MRIIMSPAKKMNTDLDSLEPIGLPMYMEQTEQILQFMQQQSHEDLQKMWKCNDKIAQQNFERLAHMDL